jgi:putative nucleotidyltransferase with HDIG domain
MQPLGGIETAEVESLRSQLHQAFGFSGTVAIEDLTRSLPVFPSIAQQALRMLANEDAGFRDIERLVSSDPVLAGEIVRCANSSEYATRTPISSIRHAISFIGAQKARRIVFAASLRPLFSSEQVKAVWNHSLELATAAEAIARVTRAVDGDEAFLAGLVHDVGRLAVLREKSERAEIYARLLASGCPPAQAEIGLWGLSHAEIGRAALTRWGFPPRVAEAVGAHHQPETSEQPLASVLYLAEDVCCAEEETPSAARLRACHQKLGLKNEPLSVPVVRLTMLTLAGLRFSK